MKSLKSYIVESIRTYHYRLKIAGEVNQTMLQLIELNLQKFTPVKIGEPKTTPIQPKLLDFPEVQNERVTSIDVEFRYPVIEPFVKQMARLLGLDENRVRLITPGYADSLDTEYEEYQNQMAHSPVLDHEELEEEKGSKAASKAYGDSYLSSIKDQAKGAKIDIPYAGANTPDAFDPFKPYLDDKKLGDKSPMSTIKRPPKPETGASVSR
jgi:hypothetical protein